MGSLNIPDIVPSPSEDAVRLQKALKGWGTDEKAVIQVLGHRNASQRRQIREAYQQIYNESLFLALDSELSSDFKRAAILWTYDPAVRDAKQINAALQSKHKKVKEMQVIVEVACAFSPQHLMAVRQAYCYLYERSVEEDIISHVVPSTRKLLVSLVSAYRYDKELVNTDVAKIEAEKLHKSIKSTQLDYDEFITILSTRNVFQLRATFDFYWQMFGKPVDQDIIGTGDIEAFLKTAIICISCPEKYFAQVIRASVAGLGTDEDLLTRIIVARAEVDMEKIKVEYENANKKTLVRAVKGDTSRDYEKFLLAILGEN